MKMPAITCRCGHDRSNHQHFRRGSDCSSCDCTRFQVRLRIHRPTPRPSAATRGAVPVMPQQRSVASVESDASTSADPYVTH